jgi:UDP-GlcNAc3NAcA epimerase
MKKILTIIGARPQFIKASAVSRIIKTASELSEVVVHTGQHFDSNMSDIFFQQLAMEMPKYNLNVNGGRHGEMTGKMIVGIEKILLKENPDIVLLYGDTNSTLAGALAASKLHIPIAHVEAGLRSHNMLMPEEINRIITDRLSTWLFTPTNFASLELKREGHHASKIFEVGDVMFDVAKHYGGKVSRESGLLNYLCEKRGININKYCLTTIHRAENADSIQRLSVIVDALNALSETLSIIWPLHPRTLINLEKMNLLSKLSEGIILIEPVGYLEMIQLEKYAALVATDSGGVQKEAFFYDVPCVTIRDETEWEELVKSGWNRVAPPFNSISLLNSLKESIGTRGRKIQPYGTGNSAQLIVDILSEN